MSRTFDGSVALVTGGTRGIGRAIAARLADAGATVVVTSRTQSAAEQAAKEMSGGDKVVRGVAMDSGDDQAVSERVKELLSDYGKIPILVNNAGVTRDALLMRMKKEDWEFVLGTNLTGVYRLCRAMVPSMVRARYGRIINITSVVAQSGNPGQVNYAAAKAGVEGMSRALAREIATRNITVNCIAPGFIDTDMTRELDDSSREKLLEQVPLNRLGQPEEIASTVSFLASRDAGYITGTTLHVNGGMYM